MSLTRSLGVLALCLLALFSLSSSPASAQSLTFANVLYNGNASWPFGAIDQWLRPLNQPITYVTQYQSSDNDNAWTTAPAGSFFLWGTQPDISISTDFVTWWYTSGTADTNSHIDPRTIPLNFPDVVTLTGGAVSPGNAMCNHRTSFNRFYMMGNVNYKTAPYPPTNVTSPASNNTVQNIYFNWVTNDGQIWNQVMANGSAYGMAQTRAASTMVYPFCVVDQKERVYLVGGNDTWNSVDLGVNWNPVVASNFPAPARVAMSGGIYSPTSTTDTIILIGGQAVAGQHLNDVWTSTNGGVSWQMIGTGPWSPRRDGVFAIHNNGVMVYLGGDCGGGWCGVYSDAYVSVNAGSQWYLLAMAPTVNINITLAASVFDQYGYLWLMAGQTATPNVTNYNWTNTIQKSSLSFSTAAITQWSSTFTGGQQFPSSATTINAINTGAFPQGGNRTAQLGGLVPVSAFTCINTLLPTIGSFNLSQLDGGNGWGTADVGLAMTVQPIIFQNPWSASGSVVDPVSGYWIGASWSIAPAGSWVVWGSNPDVAISTNLGVGWTTVAGQGGDGFTDQINDYYYSNPGGSNTASSWGNAECAGRNTFNRFYLIGNNGRNNASYPFFAWAANDAQSWTQVMDGNSSVAMAALNGTAYPSCWVDMADNVYFMSSTQVWQSTTLGRVWAQYPSTNFPPARQYMTSVIFASTPTSEIVLTVGGQSTSTNLQLNDVWLSTNYGASWTLAASAAAFSPRASPNVAVASNGAIVLHGGHYTGLGGSTTWLSDMWVSVNQGSVWYLLTSSTGTARSMAGTIIDPYGYFYVDSGWGVNSAGVGGQWLGDVFKSTLSVNNIALWGPQLISGFTSPASFACTQGQANVTFDFVSTPGSPGWGAIDQFIRVTNVPTNYVTNYGSNNINDWATAPAGSWILFGTQPDVSVSTNNGATWTITSGVSSNNNHLDLRDIPPNFPGTVGAVAGNSGCSHRTSFNRFYIIGNVQGGLSGFGAPWFAWATQDGSVWYQVMSNSSSYAMAYRVNASSPGNYPAECFVSQTERIYSVGGGDTWQSSDLGVSWTSVVSTSYFPSRLNFAAAIYSPTASVDTIVIMGGEGAQDCWQTTNGGSSWTVVSSALPWGIRGNMNLGISQNSVFVVMGGDCRSGQCGPGGQTVATPGLQTWNDVWISVTYGSTWYQITPAATAPPLSLAAVAFDSAGFMYLVAGQGSGYSAWTSNQYKSTQSLTNIISWAPKLTTGQQFTPSSSFSTPTAGAYPLGGPKSQPVSAVKPQNSLPCGPQLGLPIPSGANSGPFDFVYADNTNGWGTADLGLAVIPAPIIYEVPYTNTSYGTYWQGNAWAIAPAGSWLVWGSQPDVAISTNQGSNWTTIAGIGGAGLPNTSSVDYAPAGSLLYNAECAHRATFNRFYMIGNGDPIGTYTQVPFFNWASDDGLTWTQVLDNTTSYAMATTLDINSGQCVVGVNDVVYYIGGSAMWQSSNLGTTFTPIVPTAGVTAYMNYTGLGARQNPTAVIYSPTIDTDKIVVLGGGGGYYSAFANDVWQTADYGKSWQALTLSAGWSPRQSPLVAVGLNGVMVLYGGMAWTNSSIAGTYGWSWFQDIWVSLDGGSQWYPLNGQSVAGPRAYGAMMIDSGGYVYVSSGEATWGNWLASAYRSPYSLYNIQQWLPILNASIPIPAALCASQTASNVAYLCMLEYSLPGNVDYPWSAATSMSFSYISGTNQVTIVSGAGTRTYINRFGVQRTVAFTVAPAGTAGSNNVLSLGAIPFDTNGLALTMASAVQFPGGGPLSASTVLNIKNVGGYVMEAQSSRVDTGGTAFLSNVPGFTNQTIGASNINSLAANYGGCQAPLTFTNGLRSPTQPSASNGATTFRYTYSIGDGATYTITGTLTFTASSAFATTTDQLGNPYQTITGVTGTRIYTYLATGATVTSTVSGLSTAYGSPDQRFYPYTLIASAPGVYSTTTAPFFDASGVEFNISPSAPAPGMAPGSGTQYSATWLYMATSEATAVLTDGLPVSMPIVANQQQTYALGA